MKKLFISIYEMVLIVILFALFASPLLIAKSTTFHISSSQILGASTSR